MWGKAQKVQKPPFLDIQSPVLRFFQKNHLAQTMGHIVLPTHAKNWEDIRAVLEKKAKEAKTTTFLGVLHPLRSRTKDFFKKNLLPQKMGPI